MNWKYLRLAPWIDTRAKFVARAPRRGRLLDLGSSDGETLGHIRELRGDIELFAVDIEGEPARYPNGTHFVRLDLRRDRLPWNDCYFDAVTCMHLVEHLRDMSNLMHNIARVLKPGGRAYFETPDPKTVYYASRRKEKGGFTFNFYDDPTHVAPVSPSRIAEATDQLGLRMVDYGTSRNLLFVCAAPFSFIFRDPRKRHTARLHWLGWSSYVILEKGRPES